MRELLFPDSTNNFMPSKQFEEGMQIMKAKIYRDA
jgi:hypothetical protein